MGIPSCLCIAILFCCQLYMADGGSLELPVYVQERTIAKFLYQRDLPAMSQNTVCVWANTGADDDNRYEDYLFSISTATADNEWLLGWNNPQSFRLLLRSDPRYITSNKEEMDSLWIGWHKHCFTWKASGYLKWYSDRTTSGVLEFIKSTEVGSTTVRSGGSLILLQEQDSFFGSLSVAQTVPGKIAWFNMWNYEMTEAQVKALGCRAVGNVAAWATLQEQGRTARHLERFPCNEDEMEIQPKTYNTRQQAMMFCKIPGASLEADKVFKTVQMPSIARCISLCTSYTKCLSVNYQLSTGACVLQQVTDQGYETSFVTNKGPDYVHLTSRECVAGII